MRLGIGTALIVLFGALIGLGYLLGDYFDISKELNEYKQKAAQLELENQDLKDQINRAIQEVESLKAQVSDLGQQLLYWQEQVRQSEEQKQAIEEQIKIKEAETQALQDRIIELETLKKTWEEQTYVTPSMKSARAILPANTSTLFGMLAPILSIDIAVIYIFTRWQSKIFSRKHQESRLNNMQRGILVKLSDNEMKEIIKMRRTQ